MWQKYITTCTTGEGFLIEITPEAQKVNVETWKKWDPGL